MEEHNHFENTITINEAVETLTQIADLDLENDPALSRLEVVESKNHKLLTQTVTWLRHHDMDMIMGVVKESFKVILKYLRSFYEEKDTGTSLEQIKTIMVMVGEAAKKLEKYTQMFEQRKLSVTELKEYRKLQEFYKSKISRKLEEEVLNKWLYSFSDHVFKQDEKSLPRLVGKEATHTYVDLDSVKKDLEYELFFIRKEDGSRFFSPRLLRNIKLLSDFGSSIVPQEINDPLVDIHGWLSQVAMSNAKSILKNNEYLADQFFQEVFQFKDREIVEALTKCLMALMLASNPGNRNNNASKKSCLDYFYDFQVFLRQALYTRDYQRIVAYAGKKGNSRMSQCLMNLTNGLCLSLYCHLHGYSTLGTSLIQLVEDAHTRYKEEESLPQGGNVANLLHRDYIVMSRYLKGHPNGPLNKILEQIEQGNYHIFDSILQGNIPNALYNIIMPTHIISGLRLPAPTRQEFIHKVSINDEFKAFLRSSVESEVAVKLLLFNEQDRTSWKEHPRSDVLEELQYIPDFERVVTVVTLPKDTEFYYQMGSYAHDHQVESFLDHFHAHFGDESSGYHFPETLKYVLNNHFNNLTHDIHKTFFQQKNVLSKEARQDFIEITHLFVQLMCLDRVQPDLFSCVCKDGVDTSMASHALIYAFLDLLQAKNPQKMLNLLEELRMMTLGYPLVLRERLMLPDRFNRLVSSLRVIHNLLNELGSDTFRLKMQDVFKQYFLHSILDASVRRSLDT